MSQIFEPIAFANAASAKLNDDDVAAANLDPKMEALVRSLKNAFAQAPAASANGPLPLVNVDKDLVTKLLKQYAGDEECAQEWRKYVHMSEVHYTRNLVFSCDEFELMVVCWGPGQASRIHNHAKSHCWLSVVAGAVSEQQYQPAYIQADATFQLRSEADHPTATDQANVACPLLLLTREQLCRAGDLAYINDSISLHRVANCHISQRKPDSRPVTPTHGVPTGAAITLHLYAPPIRRVKIFEPGENTVYERTPGFFSVHGVRK